LPPTILASDAVQRLFDEPLVIVTRRAAIVNLGQIDGRHVCVSVDRSVLFISSCLAALSFPCVLACFYWIYVHNPAGLRASQGISSHAAPTVGATPCSRPFLRFPWHFHAVAAHLEPENPVRRRGARGAATLPSRKNASGK